MCEEQPETSVTVVLVTDGEMAGEEVTVMLGMWDSGPFYAIVGFEEQERHPLLCLKR